MMTMMMMMMMMMMMSYNLHMRRQSSKTLSSAAADTQKETVAKGLANNTTDTTEMFHSINEQNEMHLGRRDLIIVVQVLINRFQHLQQSQTSCERQCTSIFCRHTSLVSLTCHPGRDSGRLPPTNLLYRRSTSPPLATGLFLQFPAPVFHHTWHLHRRSLAIFRHAAS